MTGTRHRLPPLVALRAFEAAARHVSFTRAAAELGVTHGAISHQVRGLEAYLGFALFRRLPRRLVLTEAGEALFTQVRTAFDLLEMTIVQVMAAYLWLCAKWSVHVYLLSQSPRHGSTGGSVPGLAAGNRERVA